MIVPVYYEKFHCLADHCRRSCCIGWELDLDDDTAVCRGSSATGCVPLKKISRRTARSFTPFLW